MKRGLHLGFIYNSKGKLINHRPLLKVVVNPFLRPFKRCIASDIYYVDMSVKYKVIECDYVSFKDGIAGILYPLHDGYSVVKKSTIF